VPWSRSAWRTQFRSVSMCQTIFSAIEVIATATRAPRPGPGPSAPLAPVPPEKTDSVLA
jgi:hypothetical protein